MHTGKTINIFFPNYYGDKKYYTQYLTNFKYCTIQEETVLFSNFVEPD